MNQLELLTSLEHALQRHDLADVGRALEAGVNPNGFDNKEHIRPPMVEAASRNFVQAMELLYQYGGLVDGPVEFSTTTPLIAACVNGHVDVVHWLARHGADATRTSDSGMTALQIAISSKSVSVAHALVDEFPTLSGDALSKATQGALNTVRDPAIIEWLLNRGVSPNLVKDGNSWLNLLQSPNDSHGASVELLLKAGADVNFQSEGGFTALYLTVTLASVSGFSRLVRAGANPDLFSHTGWCTRRLLEDRPSKAEMLSILEAWEASQTALQAIKGAMASTAVRPL